MSKLKLHVDIIERLKKLKFVMNTKTSSAGSKVCIHDLSKKLKALGLNVAVNDWNNYAQYDVAILMGADRITQPIRKINSHIKIIIADPKQSSNFSIENARDADLLLVSSLEQREAFLRLNRNIVVYPMFPDVGEKRKKHTRANDVVITYVGNKVHLEAMRFHVSPALEAIGSSTPCHLQLIYNIKKLGHCSSGLPCDKIIPTTHIQWHENVYADTMPHTDIGIIPNFLPINCGPQSLKKIEFGDLNVNYEPFDHLQRFKASTNAGRIGVFAKYCIPVVADFTPSACQTINDGKDSFLAGSAHGWYEAINLLIRNPKLRTQMGKRLSKKITKMQNDALTDFLFSVATVSKKRPVYIRGVKNAEQDLLFYRPPKVKSLTERALNRLKKYTEGKS